MYEKEVFLLGQWKNYDDLEESLTLDELLLTYGSLIEQENRTFKFHAKLAGAEIHDDEVPAPEEETETFADRLRAKLSQQDKSGRPEQFSDGIGYEVIGG